MLPLQRVAWGLLLIVVDVTLGGWDVLLDPLGWTVVLVGTWRLPHLLGAGPTLSSPPWLSRSP